MRLARVICRIGWTRSWQREWNGFSPPLTAVQAGCQGVHDSVIYLDAPHLSWINGYKFSLSFDRGRLLLLSNKAILPPPTRANDVERRVNEAVCPLFYAPPSFPSAFFFLQLPLCRNDPFVLPPLCRDEPSIARNTRYRSIPDDGRVLRNRLGQGLDGQQLPWGRQGSAGEKFRSKSIADYGMVLRYRFNLH